MERVLKCWEPDVSCDNSYSSPQPHYYVKSDTPFHPRHGVLDRETKMCGDGRYRTHSHFLYSEMRSRSYQPCANVDNDIPFITTTSEVVLEVFSTRDLCEVIMSFIWDLETTAFDIQDAVLLTSCLYGDERQTLDFDAYAPLRWDYFLYHPHANINNDFLKDRCVLSLLPYDDHHHLDPPAEYLLKTFEILWMMQSNIRALRMITEVELDWSHLEDIAVYTHGITNTLFKFAEYFKKITTLPTIIIVMPTGFSALFHSALTVEQLMTLPYMESIFSFAFTLDHFRGCYDHHLSIRLRDSECGHNPFCKERHGVIEVWDSHLGVYNPPRFIGRCNERFSRDINRFECEPHNCGWCSLCRFPVLLEDQE